MKQKLTGNRHDSQNYYLYVSRGCLGKCSYCAIRRAVGTVKSKDISDIVAEFTDGFQNGYRNFIILGDDPGCYGIDISANFQKLLAALLEKSNELTTDLPEDRDHNHRLRFYINEIHPKFLIRYADDLMESIADSQIKGILCPVQSGNNRILKLMSREHTAEELEGTILKIKEQNPSIQLSTQIIAGFPSKSDTEFSDTLNFQKDTGFDTATVFPYDDKPNTPASKLQNKLPEKEIRNRTKMTLKFMERNGIEAYTKCMVQEAFPSIGKAMRIEKAGAQIRI